MLLETPYWKHQAGFLVLLFKVGSFLLYLTKTTNSSPALSILLFDSVNHPHYIYTG